MRLFVMRFHAVKKFHSIAKHLFYDDLHFKPSIDAKCPTKMSHLLNPPFVRRENALSCDLVIRQ